METVSGLEDLVKKVLNDHRGKEYLEKVYRKLYGGAKDIAEEFEDEIQKETLTKRKAQ